MKKKTIVKISCALLLVFGVATCLMSKYELEDQAVLEDVVGMKLPKYSLKKYAADNTLDIHGDFIDTLYIEFETLPPKALFDRAIKEDSIYCLRLAKCDTLVDNIDKAIKEDSIHCLRWSKRDEHNFYYTALYGDGGRVPKCRVNDNDWYIQLRISDNSKDAVIIYGYW